MWLAGSGAWCLFRCRRSEWIGFSGREDRICLFPDHSGKEWREPCLWHWTSHDNPLLSDRKLAIQPAMDAKITVVVVEEDRDRAIAIVDALTTSIACDVFVISEASGLGRKIAAHAPDIVLIDVDNPTRDMLEELTLASGPLERPVAMFVSNAAGALAQAAIEAGVSAYVVDGLSPARIKPVMDIAIARFRMLRQMRSELAETRRALEERKVIDRAKGLLMKARGIDEDAAYALLRKTAMNQGRRVADVAEAVVTASGLLG